MIFNFLNRVLNIDAEKTAVISPEKSFSYKELNELICQYTAILSYKYKISDGTHVAVLSDNNADFVILITAIWRLNAVPVPLNIRLLDSELENLIRHSQSKYVFVHNNQGNRLKDIQNKISFPFDEKTEPAEPIIKSGLQDSKALIMYTSGTTGDPKGVVLTYSNLVHSAETTINIVNQVPNDRWLASLPFYHIGGLQVITRTFLKGSTLILPKSLSAGSLIKTLYESAPTLASFVTTILRKFVELKIKPNPELRFAFLGGGPMDTELIKDGMKLGWNIIKVYGSTETSSMITALKCTEIFDKIESAGKAFEPGFIKIVDNSGKELLSYSTGEIIVLGKSVTKSYWNNSIETNKKIINGFYYTGDIGYLDNDGFLYIEARRTDLIISGGENINPTEVESVLLKFDGISDVCVFPVSNDEWGQMAAAAVLLKKGLTITEDFIKEYLKGKISPYKIPKKYFFVDSLPRNELGKINREEIRRIYEKI